MKKPDIKDYPPRSPHDLEWGGCDQKYFSDMLKWENLNKSELKQKELEQQPVPKYVTVILPK